MVELFKKGPELTVPEQALAFGKLEMIEENNKDAKDILNVVRKSLDKNFKNVRGINEGEKKPRLSSYIDANKAFKNAINQKMDTYKTSSEIPKIQNLNELLAITEEIQTLIDEKIIEFLQTAKDQADATKKEMVKIFEKIDKTNTTDPKLSAYEDLKNSYTKRINQYDKDNPNTIIQDNKNERIASEYKNAKSSVDDIQKVIDLKNIGTVTKRDRLLELQTFLIISDFTIEEKDILNKSINNLLITAPKSKPKKEKNQLSSKVPLNINKTEPATTEIMEKKSNLYGSMYDDILENKKQPYSINENTTDPNDKKFYDFIKAYNGIDENKGEKITEIKIGKPTSDFGKKYNSDVEYLEFTKETKKTLKPGNTRSIGGVDFSWDNNDNIKIMEEGKDVILSNNSYHKENTDKTFTLDANITKDDNNKTKVNITCKQTVENLPGTQDDLQKARADHTKIEKNNNEIKINGNTVDWKNENTGINLFDDAGNYRAFENYLTTAGPKTVKDNFENILNQINTYTPTPRTGDANDDINNLRNQYANTLTTYLNTQKNNDLNYIYLTFMTRDHLNLLGAEQATRTKNYNKFFFGVENAPINAQIRPEIQNVLTLFSDEGKKNILTNIAEVKNAIKNKKKLTPTETLSKGLDSLIEAFGPMIFSILKFFGIGKRGLLKRFPGSEKKINEMFAKEYGLSVEAKKAVMDISKTASKDKQVRDIKNYQSSEPEFPSEKTLKENFDSDMKTYEDQLSNNAKYLNINFFKNILAKYNEKNKTTSTVYDILTVTKNDNKDNKETLDEQIPIKDTTKFNQIVDEYLKSDDPRIEIAAANKNIGTRTKEKEISTNFNEYNQNINNARYQYCIGTNQDTARYMTAMLFSGKDVDYTITENELKNDNKLPVKPSDGKEKEDQNKSPETLTFNTDYVKDGAVTAAGAKKMIHEVFTDYSKAPDNLLFTPKGKTARKIEKKNDVELKDKTKVNTYIYTEDPNKGERVQITEGDKIETVAAETAEEKELGEKGEKINTAINKITDGKNYLGFDMTTYKYEATPSATKKQYETDIINPIKEMLELISDVKQINGKYFSEYPELNKFTTDKTQANKDGLTIGKTMPHIKNMLIMMGGTTNTYKAITDNMVTGTTYESGTNRYEIIMKNSSGKKIGTINFGYTEGTDKDKTRTLTPKWTANQPA